MMENAFQILTQAFKACVGWLNSLVDATGSQNFILAAFGISLVVGLLFMPMRGGNVSSWVSDFKVGKTHKAAKKYRKERSEHYKTQNQYYKSKIDYYKSKSI